MDRTAEMDYCLNNKTTWDSLTTTTTIEIDVDEPLDLRRGSWTVDEDLQLINYIATNGEGRWNLLAQRAGLKRTGKSCRLRWLNYLRPDVRRGNITPEEQLLILQLHSRWGNRWSKIAQQMPGRTDNEIKNYWRTRVQKHARQLHCDINSNQFKDLVTNIWMPRLIQTIHQQQQQKEQEMRQQLLSSSTAAAAATTDHNHHHDQYFMYDVDCTAVGPAWPSSINMDYSSIQPMQQLVQPQSTSSTPDPAAVSSDSGGRDSTNNSSVVSCGYAKDYDWYSAADFNIRQDGWDDGSDRINDVDYQDYYSFWMTRDDLSSSWC